MYKVNGLYYKQLEVIVDMDFIVGFIVELFKMKNPKESEYNNFINLLIFLVVYFGIFIAILWLCSKLGVFA